MAKAPAWLPLVTPSTRPNSTASMTRSMSPATTRSPGSARLGGGGFRKVGVSYAGLSNPRRNYGIEGIAPPTTRQALAPFAAPGQAARPRLRAQHRGDTDHARPARIPEGIRQVGAHAPRRPGDRRQDRQGAGP